MGLSVSLHFMHTPNNEWIFDKDALNMQINDAIYSDNVLNIGEDLVHLSSKKF